GRVARTQAERESKFRLRKVTRPRLYRSRLRAIRRREAHYGADRVAVGFRAGEPQPQAVYAGRDVVAVQIRRPLIGGEEQVEIAIAVKIAIGQAARHFRSREAAACLCRYILEMAASAIQKKMRRLGITGVAVNLADGLVNVTVDRQQVEAAVEVDVQERASEAET